jgi:hypothetical protein
MDATWQRRIWGDPGKRWGNHFAPPHMQPGNEVPASGGVDDGKVVGFLKGLSKYGPKPKGAQAADGVQTLGMTHGEPAAADAALLKLYEGDPAAQSAILARMRFQEADAAAAGAAAGADALTEAAPAGTAAANPVESTMQALKNVDATTRTEVLGEAVRANAAAGVGPSLEEVLAAAIRAAPTDASHESLAIGLEQVAAQRAAKAAAEAAPVVERAATTVEHAAPAVEHAAPVVEHVAPVVEHAAPVVEHVAPAIEHVAPAIEHVAPAIEHAAPVVANVAKADGLVAAVANAARKAPELTMSMEEVIFRVVTEVAPRARL